jgi:hypothetical protein
LRPFALPAITRTVDLLRTSTIPQLARIDKQVTG